VKHIVSLSGGTASAVSANRVIERYGSENATLWFADTLWEDEDLYRFLDDLESFWEKKIERFTDGRNPLQVAEDASIIPNQRRAPCSLQLKVFPFRRYLLTQPRPVTVHIGFDATEEHRMARPKKEYEAIEGVTVDFPLLWKPTLFMQSPHEIVASWGIKVPRMYEEGFSHNNCGGRCVKQGHKDWRRLLQWKPERFTEVRDWEEVQRAKGGARANYAILRDQSNNEVQLPLIPSLEKTHEADPQLGMFSGEDAFGCFCET
jgi:hypothetical protein